MIQTIPLVKFRVELRRCVSLRAVGRKARRCLSLARTGRLRVVLVVREVCEAP